jgi:hypothetical protein
MRKQHRDVKIACLVKEEGDMAPVHVTQCFGFPDASGILSSVLLI